jgi:hypothetical protein
MHAEFSRSQMRLKLFNDNGTELLNVEARNNTVAVGEGIDGQCPYGDYQLGPPEKVDPPEIPFGLWYTPILDINGLWNYHHRSGLGVHGGGSGLADPFAPRQGWQITEGCIRLQNQDNETFRIFLQHAQARQILRLTVTA